MCVCRANTHQCHPSSISSIFMFNSSNEVSIPGSSNPPFSSIFCENVKRDKRDQAVLLLSFSGYVELMIEIKEKRKDNEPAMLQFAKDHRPIKSVFRYRLNRRPQI